MLEDVLGDLTVHVGAERLADPLALLKPRGHLVKGARKLARLVGREQRDAGSEIPGAELPGRRPQAGKRLADRVRQQQREHQGHRACHCRRDQDDHRQMLEARVAAVGESVGCHGGDHVDRRQRDEQAHTHRQPGDRRRRAVGEFGGEVAQDRANDPLSVEEPERRRVQEQHDRPDIGEGRIVRGQLELPHEIQAPQQVEQPDEIHGKPGEAAAHQLPGHGCGRPPRLDRRLLGAPAIHPGRDRSGQPPLERKAQHAVEQLKRAGQQRQAHKLAERHAYVQREPRDQRHDHDVEQLLLHEQRAHQVTRPMPPVRPFKQGAAHPASPRRLMSTTGR